MPDESERLKKLEGDFAKALEESVNATLLCDRGHSRCVSEK